ncbi:hypothetical protein [Ralstonia wenshanensis]|uniref:hypothetical protein n=1 Tax=Ralstonia wenshanensis TaxID=2842456 RepID=UPI0039C6ED36
MQTTTPELSPELQARLDAYKTARSAFELARDEVARCEAGTQKLTKTLEAAENEACQARKESVTLMRSPVASLKDIHQLKAKERASYTMVEDYRAIIEEQKLAGEEAKLNAGVAKREESGAFTLLLKSYADELAREASNHLAPVLRALHVWEMALRQEGAATPGAQWQHFHNTAREAAKECIRQLIEQALDAYEYDEAADVVLQAATRPAGLDRFQAITPFAHTKQKERLEQAATQLRQRGAQLTTEVQP